MKCIICWARYGKDGAIICGVCDAIVCTGISLNQVYTNKDGVKFSVDVKDSYFGEAGLMLYFKRIGSGNPYAKASVPEFEENLRTREVWEVD